MFSGPPIVNPPNRTNRYIRPTTFYRGLDYCANFVDRFVDNVRHDRSVGVLLALSIARPQVGVVHLHGSRLPSAQIEKRLSISTRTWGNPKRCQSTAVQMGQDSWRN